MQVDDTAFGQLVAAESGRLARLGTLLTGDPARGRALAEEALARALLDWRHVREDEPVAALRRSLFSVYAEWWRPSYRRYRRPRATEPKPDATATEATDGTDDPADADGAAGAEGAAGGGNADGADSAGHTRGVAGRAGGVGDAADGAGSTGAGSAGSRTGGTGGAGGAGEYALVGAGVSEAGMSTSANGPYARAATTNAAKSAKAATTGAGESGSVEVAPPLEDEQLGRLSPWARAVALLDAEGRSEPEMVGLTGLSERAVTRSRPVAPMLELANALAGADAPVSMERVARRAAWIRWRRRVGAVVACVLLAIPAAMALRSSGDGGQDNQLLADKNCPQYLPPQVGNSGVDLTQEILPGDPATMLLCQYGPDGSRTGARKLDSGLAIDIAGALNAARQSGETDVCSKETGSPFVLRVLDRDRIISLLADPNGCGRVSNGFRTVSAGRDLLTQILAGQVTRKPESALHSCSGLPQSVQNIGKGLATRLVGFTGSRIVVCPQGAAQVTIGELSGDKARDLALAIDQAPIATKLAKGCPSGEHFVVVVTGEVGRVDLLVDAKSGCGWASNGIRIVELDHDTLHTLRALGHLPD